LCIASSLNGSILSFVCGSVCLIMPASASSGAFEKRSEGRHQRKKRLREKDDVAKTPSVLVQFLVSISPYHPQCL